jgi:hypothetical protein
VPTDEVFYRRLRPELSRTVNEGNEGKTVPWGLGTVPYGTVPFFARIPGNELPGYLHSVPPGQRLRFLLLAHIGSCPDRYRMFFKGLGAQQLTARRFQPITLPYGSVISRQQSSIAFLSLARARTTLDLAPETEIPK